MNKYFKYVLYVKIIKRLDNKLKYASITNAMLVSPLNVEFSRFGVSRVPKLQSLGIFLLWQNRHN